MQSNTRFYVIIAVVIVALAGFWFLIRGDRPKVDQAAKPVETASKPDERAPRDEAAPERPAPTKRELSGPIGEMASTKPDLSAAAVSGDGSITGIAKHSSGDPIAGATVRILAMGWKSYEKRPADAKTIDTMTDNDGKFSIKNLPLKTSIGLIAELGPLFAVESVYIGERTKTAEVELTLMPTSFVAGTVVNSDGEPVPGALLDRLTHRVHILEANGESYRLDDAKKRTRKQQRENPEKPPSPGGGNSGNNTP